MAQFALRNLEDDVHKRISTLADQQGQSTEEFVRNALRSIALQSTEHDFPLDN